MRYSVVITRRARHDLETARKYIEQSAPETAKLWVDSFLAALMRLENNPQFWPLAPESREYGSELRQLSFRTKSRNANQALFEIIGAEVRVLAIRRPGQPPVKPDDLR